MYLLSVCPLSFSLGFPLLRVYPSLFALLLVDIHIGWAVESEYGDGIRELGVLDASSERTNSGQTRD